MLIQEQILLNSPLSLCLMTALRLSPRREPLPQWSPGLSEALRLTDGSVLYS